MYAIFSVYAYSRLEKTGLKENMGWGGRAIGIYVTADLISFFPSFIKSEVMFLYMNTNVGYNHFILIIITIFTLLLL